MPAQQDIPGFTELSPASLRGFFGGINLRDAPDELAASESPDLWNVVLDERGGFGSRLGMTKWNTTPYGAARVSAIFEWRAGGHTIVQCGASLYLDFSTTAFKTFTTAARCGFAEFAGKVFFIHPIDGLFSSDGTSGGTAVVPSGPKGTTLAVWQNRLWAAGLTARLYFSAIGTGTQWTPSASTLNGSHTLPQATITVASTAGFDPAGALAVGTATVAYTGITPTTFTGCTGGTGVWPTGTPVTQGQNYNDLIEKNEQPIVCLRGASGQDIIGLAGLLAFKRRSTYRITDPDTGAYVTIDPTVGCGSDQGAVVLGNRVYTITQAGICWTDGRGPMRPESDKLRPLWSDQQIAFDQADIWCIGRRGEHIVASVPTRGKTACDLALEHYPAARPQDASTVIGSNAASCYANLTAGTETLLSGSPTVNGQVYVNGTGGTDDGQPIHAYYQTAWLAPHSERLARVRSALIEGRGSFSLYVKTDYAHAQGDYYPVAIRRGGFQWNSGVKWNDGSKWGPALFAGYSDPIPSLGTCRVLSFKVEATTSDTVTAPALSNATAAPTVGSWAVYVIHIKTVPLRQL